MTAPISTSSSLYKLLKNIPRLYNKNLGNVYSVVSLGNSAQSNDQISFYYIFGVEGSGNGQFNNPSGVCTDSSGNIYVVDNDNSRVQKFSSEGVYISQFAVSPSIADTVSGIAIDSFNNLYVCNLNNNIIQVYNSAGVYQFSFGSTGSGHGQFNGNIGVVVDSLNNVYVVDYVNNNVQKFNSSGVFQLSFGSMGSGIGQFNDPEGIAVDSSNNIYIVDNSNNRVQIFNSSGSYISQFPTGGSGGWIGICLDIYGNIVLTNSNTNMLYVFKTNGTLVAQFGSSGSGDGQFESISFVAASTTGYLYVVDTDNNRIQILKSSSGYSTGIILNGTIYPQASNVVKLLGASGFVLDNFLNDIQNGKQETYIGSVTVEIDNLPSGGAVAGASLDAIALPGYIFDINQTTAGQTITFPFPVNVNRRVYIIINNIGTAAFTMYGVTIQPGSTQTYNYTYGLSGAIQTWVPITSVNAVQVAGADYLLPTSTPQGNGVDYLSLVGTGFNTPRDFISDDPTYKLWINQNVTGPKISPLGIQQILNTIFPGLGAKVFDWFPSSYSQLITLLTANPGYLAYSVPSGNSYSIPGEPNYPSYGPAFNFYVTVPGISTPITPGGVYADWSFADFGEATVDLLHYGGFFSDLSVADILPTLINIIQNIKAAGTTPVIVLL